MHCGALHVRFARFAQDELRRQATSQAHDEPQLTLPQAPLPAQSTLHDPPPQVMSLHEPRPLQDRLQGPDPQVTLLQLCLPPQVTVHALLLVQLTPLLHEPSAVHAMLQAQPAGHVTSCLQLPVSAQSMRQVFAPVLHDVHCDGHAPGWASPFTPESTIWLPTQKPSLQVRPSAQSDCFSQAKSPLRWVTEQPPAVTTATPKIASQSRASFTACLRS
jgi:hypothetical protein